MELCIAVNQNGRPCTFKINKKTHLERSCLKHFANSLVARPDITIPPENALPRNQSKLNAYANDTCFVVGCGQPNLFGEFVCDIHEWQKMDVLQGISDERSHFTPYYQHIILQQDLHENDLEYQERIRQDKEKKDEVLNYIERNQRDLNPYYINTCCYRGNISQLNHWGELICQKQNRFGYFTCEEHLEFENNARNTFDEEANQYSKRYKELKYQEIHDPRQNDPEFQAKINEHIR